MEQTTAYFETLDPENTAVTFALVQERLRVNELICKPASPSTRSTSTSSASG